MDKILHDFIYLNYGVYGTILYLGQAGFCPSTVSLLYYIVLCPTALYGLVLYHVTLDSHVAIGTFS